MDVLDLPSISDDDELDYDLADNIDVGVGVSTNETSKSAEKEAGTTHQQLNEEEDEEEQQGNKRPSLFQRLSRKRRLHGSDSSSGREEEEEVLVLDETIEMPGRLAGRVKRIKSRGQVPEGEDEDNEEDEEEGQNFAAGRFAEILEGKGEKHRNLKDAELEELYASLDANIDDANVRFKNLLITGDVEKMNTFDVSRIFAQFNPENVRPMDASSFIVTFSNELIAAEVLIEMSKPLRRVRKPKKPEEGELVESSEEDEGQVKEEDGEDVAIVKDSPMKRKDSLLRADSDSIEIDVEKVKVPAGKWRLITQHVPDNKLVFVRFATGIELRRSVYFAAEQSHRGEEEDFPFKNAKIRPGLNVFDEKGNELDWDYEHDTRFFEDIDQEKAGADGAGQSTAGEGGMEGQGQQTVTEIAGVKIRSRGRGAKKFMQAFNDSDGD